LAIAFCGCVSYIPPPPPAGNDAVHVGRAGHVATMAVNEWAYTVLAAAMSVTDDTALVAKVVCAELRVRGLSACWPGV
jgi:hypothetical protein